MTATKAFCYVATAVCTGKGVAKLKIRPVRPKARSWGQFAVPVQARYFCAIVSSVIWEQLPGPCFSLPPGCLS